MSRKPVMSKDKRKVLNLLEFISELCPSLGIYQILNDVVPDYFDVYDISDEELAGWLQDYADNLLHYGEER